MVVIERVSPETLYNWLEGPNPPAVVDVRDEDHIGGHVRGSIHIPSTKFLNELGTLRRQLQLNDRVVFYCQFSQQRGPTCAQHFALRSARSDLPFPMVFVLDGGFSNWASTYSGKDGHTEAFQNDLYS